MRRALIIVATVVALLLVPGGASGQSSTLPNLSAATSAADADLLLIRKSGETRDKKITKANLFSGVAFGPASPCSDNSIPRIDGASATQLQCSTVTATDGGQISAPGGISIRTHEYLSDNIAFQAGSVGMGYLIVGNDALSVLSTDSFVSVLGSNLSFYSANKGIEFEGASNDAYEVVLTSEDATADRTVRVPDASGTLVLREGIGKTYSMADASAVNLFSVQLATQDTGCAVEIAYSYFVTNATDTAVHAGTATWSVTNDDGTVTGTATESGETVNGTGCAAACDTFGGSVASTTYTATATFDNSLSATGSLQYNVLFSTCGTMSFSP